MTKLSDFRPSYEDSRYVYAIVQVTTGHLWWKRSRLKCIRRRQCHQEIQAPVPWRFQDTGEYTPGWQAEYLEARYLESRRLSKEKSNNGILPHEH